MRRLSLVLPLAALFAGSGFGQAPVPNPKDVEKVEKALPAEAPAKPKAKRNILIFSRTAGFRHGSIAIGTRAITLLGDKTGAYTAFATEDESYFEPEKLAKFDAVFMLNTTGDCFKPAKGSNEEKAKREEELKASLVDFVKGGKGLVGIHSATDTYGGWKEYNKMMGGAFDGHPWNEKVPIKIADAKSPVNAAFDGKDFSIADEIYQFKPDTALPTDRKFLLVMDAKAAPEKKDAKRKDGLYPISWIAGVRQGPDLLLFPRPPRRDLLEHGRADALPRRHPVRPRRPGGGRDADGEEVTPFRI